MPEVTKTAVSGLVYLLTVFRKYRIIKKDEPGHSSLCSIW